MDADEVTGHKSAGVFLLMVMARLPASPTVGVRHGGETFGVGDAGTVGIDEVDDHVFQPGC